MWAFARFGIDHDVLDIATALVIVALLAVGLRVSAGRRNGASAPHHADASERDAADATSAEPQSNARADGMGVNADASATTPPAQAYAASGESAASAHDVLRATCTTLARSHGLSEREAEVLLLLAQGRSRREIEAELVVSINTVKSHISHVYAKLGIHSLAELNALLGIDRPHTHA